MPCFATAFGVLRLKKLRCAQKQRKLSIAVIKFICIYSVSLFARRGTAGIRTSPNWSWASSSSRDDSTCCAYLSAIVLHFYSRRRNVVLKPLRSSVIFLKSIAEQVRSSGLFSSGGATARIASASPNHHEFRSAVDWSSITVVRSQM